MSLAPLFPIWAGIDDVLGKFLNWASHEKEAQMLYKFRVGPPTCRSSLVTLQQLQNFHIKKLLTPSSNPRLKDINENCLDQFRKHWECLEQNNQQLWHCRPAERSLNACVFEKLVCLCLCSGSAFPSSLQCIHILCMSS